MISTTMSTQSVSLRMIGAGGANGKNIIQFCTSSNISAFAWNRIVNGIMGFHCSKCCRLIDGLGYCYYHFHLIDLKTFYCSFDEMR